MQEIKYCQRCGKLISDVNASDWYSHISKKYCEICRRESDREKTALRVAALRAWKKQKDKYRDEQLELLKQENELLRKRIIMQREELAANQK